MSETLDGHKSRSAATQQALMLAAERLIAQKGIKDVSIREIVKTAGQKNESALQYHFKNLHGLINAVHDSRNAETQKKRAELLETLLSENTKPALRDLSRIMVTPAFLLAKANKDFRNYMTAFSHELALTPNSALTRMSKGGGGGESGRITGDLLRAALPHLDESAYRLRMDSAVRFVSISMSHHARQKNAFRGASAELFVSNLIDAVAGLLSAPVSAQTKAIVNSIDSTKK